MNAAASMPNPGALKGEIGGLQAKKAELSGAREQIKGAISELEGREDELDSNIGQLENALSDENTPPEYRVQIQERLAFFKNAKDSISAQIKNLQEKLEFIAGNFEALDKGISMRKQALQKLAGMVARRGLGAHQMQINRELGRVKG
jgi:chromosome segregation ATPase